MRFCLLLTVGFGTLGCAAGPAGDGGASRIDRVTASLVPAVRVVGRTTVTYDLPSRMAYHRTPAISIAVADSGRIAWVRAIGVKEAGTADSVTPATLFQAASISKPVAATAMLKLVDEGRLDLDRDVNAYLTSWKLPDSRFTASEKVTLRRLVSHSAGLTVHGFPGYAVDSARPTIPQILDGAAPANTAPVRSDTFPGAVWRYSGGGTTVMQLLLTDVTGEPFPSLAKRLVLEPAAMDRSTYEQPLPATLAADVAAGHRQNGEAIPGRWHVYPEMAAAGLWTTPTDLLKWAIAITAARDGVAGAILSQGIAREMLTPQKQPSGLGPQLGGSGAGFNFGHGGSNHGFRCQLIYFPETGQGAAVMTNGDNGSTLAQEVLFAIAAEYGWLEYGPREVQVVAMDSAALGAFAGRYELAVPIEATIEVTANARGLYLEVPGFLPHEEVVFVSDSTAVGVDSGTEVGFEVGADGRPAALIIGGLRAIRAR